MKKLFESITGPNKAEQIKQAVKDALTHQKKELEEKHQLETAKKIRMLLTQSAKVKAAIEYARENMELGAEELKILLAHEGTYSLISSQIREKFDLTSNGPNNNIYGELTEFLPKDHLKDDEEIKDGEVVFVNYPGVFTLDGKRILKPRVGKESSAEKYSPSIIKNLLKRK